MSLQGLSAHIVLEGNICAGKSTICKHIRKELGDSSVLQSELTEDKFLSAFYQNMQHFAFPFQMFMLTTRLFQANEGRRLSKQGKLVLTDRGILGDWTFARKNWLDSNLDDEQYAIYQDTVNKRALTNLHEKVDLTVYLDVEPEECSWRMRELRKTQAEEGVLTEYLVGIDDVYFEGMINMLAKTGQGVRGKALVVDWTSFGNEEAVVQRAADILEGRAETPCINFMTQEEAEQEMYQHDCFENLSLPEQIDEAYSKIREHCSTSAPTSPPNVLDLPIRPVGDMEGSWTNKDPVYVRFNMCLSEKPSRSDAMKPRTNAFKRVVMNLLSQGRTVNFYRCCGDSEEASEEHMCRSVENPSCCS